MESPQNVQDAVGGWDTKTVGALGRVTVLSNSRVGWTQ
jgi:hypothetical protein